MNIKVIKDHWQILVAAVLVTVSYATTQVHVTQNAVAIDKLKEKHEVLRDRVQDQKEVLIRNDERGKAMVKSIQDLESKVDQVLKEVRKTVK